jgi:predicted nucleic acid-binding protein
MANPELAAAAEVAELRRRLNQLEDRFTGLAQQLRPAANAAHRRSNTMDLKIAAIAMSHDALLVSRNAAT